MVQLKWNPALHGFDVVGLSPIGTIVCFAEDDDGVSLVRAQRNLRGWIDPNLCIRWLSRCEGWHGLECSPSTFDTSKLQMKDGEVFALRLVDVETLCIVDAPDTCRYIALSYVWGDSEDGRLVLNRPNKSILAKPYALHSHWDSIPMTISSAITMVKNLGERYLWVDSLCLVQDDQEELQECVEIMDAFYAMAILTIVAASGPDARSGLPGVYPTQRKSTRLVKEVLPSLWMTTVEDFDTFLRNSTYSRRAWT